MNNIEYNALRLYSDYSKKSVKFKSYFSDEVNKKDAFERIWLLFDHIPKIALQDGRSQILRDIDLFVTSNTINISIEKEVTLIFAIYDAHIDSVFLNLKSALSKILYEHLLFHTEILIEQGLPILRNEELKSLAPLIFNNTYWKKVVNHDLSLIKNKDIIEITVSDYLMSIEKLIERYNEKDSAWARKFYSGQRNQIKYLYKLKSNTLKFFDIRTLEKKRDYLNDILSNRICVKSKTKKEKKRTEDLKIELSNPKDIRRIIKGLTYLVTKQNPNISYSDSKSIAKLISMDIFDTGRKIRNQEISYDISSLINSINFDNKILMEFILFLSNADFFKKQNRSFPKVISNNISINKRGFSYQNLYLLTKEIKDAQKLTFRGLTSSIALENEMKY